MYKPGDRIRLLTRPGHHFCRVVTLVSLYDVHPTCDVEELPDLQGALSQDGVFQVLLVEHSDHTGTQRDALLRLGEGWRETRGRALYLEPVR